MSVAGPSNPGAPRPSRLDTNVSARNDSLSPALDSSSDAEESRNRQQRLRSNSRPPPPNLAGPTRVPDAVLARIQLERGGSQSSRASFAPSSVHTNNQSEPRPIWGIGGVFPNRNTSARRPNTPVTRDYEAERQQAAASTPNPSSHSSRSPAPRESSGTPSLEERGDPFSILPRTGPELARVTTWPPGQEVQPSADAFAPSSSASSSASSSTHVTDDPITKEKFEGESNPKEQSSEEQVQVGGPLMEDGDQWQDEFEQPEPGDLPVRNDWGRLRYVLREPLAEFLGMLVLICLGVGADCQVKISATSAGTYSDMYTTWGIATMAATYIAGGISGGHMSPAITISLAIFRGFPWRMVPRYIIAQVFGAFCGALIIYGNYKRALDDYDPLKLIISTDAGNASAPLFITAPNMQVAGTVQGFFQELLSSALLAIFVLALGDENNAPPGAGLGAAVLGTFVIALGMSMGWLSGYPLNPARDLGPRLALWVVGYGTKLWTHDSCWWIVGPIVGPIVGSVLGCFVYDLCIFTGAGSPINSSPTEISQSLGIPKMHNMVRHAFPSIKSPQNEVDIENASPPMVPLSREERKRMVNPRGRRAGRAPKKDVEINSRWQAGGESIRKEEEGWKRWIATKREKERRQKRKEEAAKAAGQ